MPRILPLRWVPALNMHRRGDTIEEIASMYSAEPRFVTAHLKYLNEQYPGTFPERSNAVLASVTVQRLVARPSLRDRVRSAFLPQVSRLPSRTMVPARRGPVRKKVPGDRSVKHSGGGLRRLLRA